MTGIDWLILAYISHSCWHRRGAEGLHEDQHGFFLAGRAIPAWVCGLAFMSANLGAQEVIGMGASGAKYGIATRIFIGSARFPRWSSWASS